MSGLDTSMTLLPYFAKKTQLSSFLHYLNSRHDNIQFTIEFENDQQIPFLDVSIKRLDNNSFSTSIYYKKTFTGLYTKWDSFTPWKYKINLIVTLTYRCLRNCSSSSLLLLCTRQTLRNVFSTSWFLLPMVPYNWWRIHDISPPFFETRTWTCSKLNHKGSPRNNEHEKVTVHDWCSY